jgi:Polyketide cyclase / dehydrase and lipid transport
MLDMASIQRTIPLKAEPGDVWDALRDWPAVHERVARGFVVDTAMDGDDRIVTFFNGAVAREVLVALDDENRRLVWSVVDGPYSHHNAVAQVLAADGGGARLVWTADFLPHDLADRMSAMMDRGAQAISETFGG